jgi:hypothetical protein
VQTALQTGRVPPVDAEIERQPFLGDSGFQAQRSNGLGEGAPDLIRVGGFG